MHSCHQGSVLLIVVIITALYSIFVIQSWRITSSLITAHGALLEQTHKKLLIEDLLYYAIARYPHKASSKQQKPLGYQLIWPQENLSSQNHQQPYTAKILYAPSKRECSINVGLYTTTDLVIAPAATVHYIPTLTIASWKIYHS